MLAGIGYAGKGLKGAWQWHNHLLVIQPATSARSQIWRAVATDMEVCPMVSRKALRVFPEMAAGGYSRYDPLVHFYSRVNALIEPNMTVLDMGAGRGRAVRDPCRFRRQLRTLKGRVKKIIGVDVDPEVMENPLLDEAIVIGPRDTLPLPNESVDLIVANYVFEHVKYPEEFARELARVLRPGGWICALTPNRLGYIGLAVNLVPNKYHHLLLRILQPRRTLESIFPTSYKINTWGALKRLFPDDRFHRIVYTLNGQAQYSMDSSVLVSKLTLFLFRFIPEYLGATFMIFMQRKEPNLEEESSAAQ